MGNCMNSSSAKGDSNLNTSGMSKVGYIMLTSRSEGELLSSPNLKSFSFLVLKKATRNFHPDSLLGEGEYGYVFKGYLASKTGSGMAIAVKKLKPDPKGFQGHTEWLTKITYRGQLHHPNLEKLIGYCTEGDKRLLVYEFLPKGSLENHLFGRAPQPLPWATRLKVAIGVARGLAFLHDAKDRVIYLGLKASNILLDAEFNAKLSDFCLAKAGPTSDRIHQSEQSKLWYAAPELITTGRWIAKSDVYSFGVILVELLTGRRAGDEEKVGLEKDLVKWTKPYLGDKQRLFRIMDAKLEGQYPQKAVYTAATLALQCLSTDHRTRPRMSDVLAILEELQTDKNVSKDHQTVSSPAPKSPDGHRR